MPYGVSGRVSFRQEDLFKTPLNQASVITLYLLPELNARLAPRLMTLRPGTRVVSHRFPMDDWKPDVTDTAGGTVYLWIVPARVAGRWEVGNGDRRFTLEFKQSYQELSGIAIFGDTTVVIREGRLRGDAITFSLDINGRAARFSGTVRGNMMQGTPDGLGFGGQEAAWSAQKM